MQIHVLGSIEASNSETIALGGPTQRRILAMLALNAGDIVSIDRMVEETWPDGDLPDQAERNIRTYVHRLRAALGDEFADRIETITPGYRLRLSGDELDADEFAGLVATAVRLDETGETVRAIEAIGQAERLWRGLPYGEFSDASWAVAEVERLTELHVEARERKTNLLLRAGRATAAVSSAEGLVASYPLRERPRVLLMQALYQAGRQPEALRAFQDYRHHLVEEIGIDPSQEMVALDRAIAANDPELRSDHTATRTVGAYDIQERIGEGAFAVVHRARQSTLGRDVAVKVVRAELANRPEFIRRFEAEAQMVAQIEHPSIVPLYDYWREPGRAYLVMRLMTGGSLEARLDDGRLDVDDALAVIDSIAGALSAAHSAGVVHRDVKPANILFDDDGRAYLGDFGIALDATELAAPEAALSEGSPVFASPEQLRREPVTPSADVHALGIVAFTALAGRTPFDDAPDPAEQLERQLSNPIPRLATDRPDIPDSVDAVLAIATAKSPIDRYPSAPEFAQALRSAFSGSFSPSGVALGPRTNPYKGLRAFDETDTENFYGRERLTDELVAKLSESDSTLVSVVGPSGSGKSSVVRAGLVPALRAGRVPGSASWFATTMTPGIHPFEALETALLRVAVNPPGSLLDQLRGHPRGLLRSVRRVLAEDKDVLLLVIDQFEELFTAAVDPRTTEAFVAAIATAATEPGSPLRVILTLRADFYDRPLRHAGFASLLKATTVAVVPPAPDELEKAIVAPAASVGVTFEPGLVSQIVADVASQPGALPLLQYALTELFEATTSDQILLDDYRRLGGINGALARRADVLYDGLSSLEQTRARSLFGRLVTLGEGSEDTRRRVQLSEAVADETTQRVIDVFGAARLLTLDRHALTREPTVEVAHEALIREWPRLQEWLDEDREGLRNHRHLSTSATAWQVRDRDDGELYRGVRLESADTWIANESPALNTTEADFLAASRNQRDAEQAAEHGRVRRLRRLLATTAVVAAMALIAGAVALRQQSRADDAASDASANALLAEERAEEAETARALADIERLRALAQVTAPDNPDIAALLAVEAYRLDPSVESLDTLHRVMTAAPGLKKTIGAEDYRNGTLLSDGTTLVVRSAASIDVWNLATRQLLRSTPFALEQEDDANVRSAVRADGEVVAIGETSGRVQLLNANTGEPLGTIDAGPSVQSIQLSPSTDRLAIVTSDGPVQIWDLDSLTRSALIEPSGGRAWSARWNPVDDRLAIVTEFSDVELWAPGGTEPLWASVAPDDPSTLFSAPVSAIFTPDGAHLVVESGLLNAIFRTYLATDGSQPFPNTVRSQAEGTGRGSLFWLDADRMLLGAPASDHIAVYDISTAKPMGVPVRRSSARNAQYSPVLDRIITVGSEGIRLWALDGSGPLEQVAPLTNEQIAGLESTGGTVHAALSQDASRLLVSTQTFPEFAPTTEFDLSLSLLRPAIFDPAGPLVYTYGHNTMVFNWAAFQLFDANNEPVSAAIPITHDMTDQAASADGRYAALAKSGGRIDLYGSNGDLLAELQMPDVTVQDRLSIPSFTSDGNVVGLNTGGGNIAVWSTETYEPLGAWYGRGTARLAGPWLLVVENEELRRFDPWTLEEIGTPLIGPPEGFFYPVADELAGRIAVPGTDTAVVYDLESGLQLGRELPYAPIRIQYSADGKVLMVAGEDRVTLWNYDTDSWADIACGLAGRNLTEIEWEQLGPRTIERRATCEEFPLN